MTPAASEGAHAIIGSAVKALQKKVWRTLHGVDLLPPLLGLPLVEGVGGDVLVLALARGVAVQLRAGHQLVRAERKTAVPETKKGC